MTLGIDLGAVDGNTSIDWQASKTEHQPDKTLPAVPGASFVYLKKSEHLAPDHQYAPSSDAARAAGLVVGAYLFPRCNVNSATPKEQVAAFKNAPGDITPGIDFPPCLDVEFPGGVAHTGRSKADLVDFVRQFVLEMEKAFGVPPMIYTAMTQWWDLGLPAAPWAARCPLFVKTAYVVSARKAVYQSYVAKPHKGALASDPRDYYRIPDPFLGYWIQQWQGDVLDWPGFNNTVDVNRFNVTRPGDIGGHVEWLQRRLVTLPGPQVGPLNADGVFGPDLELAVRAVQAAHGLIANGVVDPATFAAIAWK